MDLNRKKELHERSFNQRNSELNLSGIQDKIVFIQEGVAGYAKGEGNDLTTGVREGGVYRRGRTNQTPSRNWVSGRALKVFPSVDHAFAFAGEVCSIPDLQLESEGFQENKVKMRCFLCNENGLIRCPSC
ncbi:hypothetical protein LIER_37744 [Lithospermum erythrorhizon]|uniref:Uncharacterized protein n=1 Tax=Lithospermum erythrorhizon TaxID=34254 RepID=A0AAV3PRN1_LITER